MRRFGAICGCLLFPCLLCGEGVVLRPSKMLYDRKGIVLRGILSANNTYYEPVGLDRISPFLISAVIAAEDKRFYAHSGVDVAAVLRAAWQNAQGGEVVSGASTITQQLARAISPRPKTWWGKTKEAFSAVSLEQNYTKEEILEQYFNLLEFGNLTQGAQAASQFYFGVDAADLSLAQAAFLAGVLKSPTYYNPLTHFTRSIKRQQYVLEKMYENGFVDEELYQLARAENITLQAKPRPFYAPHFTQFVSSFLPADSTHVQTTLDFELQSQVEQIIKNQLPRLEESHVTNAAVVVLDNATGGILAYVGSADFNDKKHSGQVDGVRALRQPGSALKPFVYGLAFEKHTLTPATLIEDTDTFFEGGFRPHNYDEDFHGSVSARTALACSYNIPAVKVAETLGASGLLAFLHQLGFVSLTKTADFYGLGISLGNGEVRLLELANAYAALARGGVFKPVQLASKPLVKLPGQPSPVLSEKSSYLVTDILKDNQARSPAFGLNSPLSVPFEMAAKTGTSKDYKDNFAIGYTPRWTVGVWVGNFDASPMQKVSGVTGAGPILRDVALALQTRYPAEPFQVPPGLRRTKVCNESGLLAASTCTHTHEEILDVSHLPALCDGKHMATLPGVQITSPAAGDIFYVDPAAPRKAQQLKLAATCPSNQCVWSVNGQKLPGTACQTWWPLVGGQHQLSVSCNGQTDQIHLEVVE